MQGESVADGVVLAVNAAVEATQILLLVALPRPLIATRATSRQIVLAWLLARSPAILPIPGTGSMSHLEHNIAAVAIKLTPAEVASVTHNAG
jgi:aryl-alcohol dehydrogenase-like predicted oxidoreductase